MEFQCLALFFSLIVILMAAQASLPSEVYWERKLPNTPIPKVIRQFSKQDGGKDIASKDEFLLFGSGDKKNKDKLLRFGCGDKENKLQDDVQDISPEDENLLLIYDRYAKNKLQDDLQDISPEDENFLLFYDRYAKNKLQDDVQDISPEDENLLLFYDRYAKNKLQDNVQDISPEDENLLDYEKSKLQDDVQDISPEDENLSGYKKNGVVLRGIGPIANHHHHDHLKPSSYFSEEGLRRGAKLVMLFHKRKFSTPLLTREIAEHLPFSSEKINEILEILAVKPDSKNAKNVEKTLNNCEEPALKGEEKHCATSVESMVDFVTSKLGNNARVTSTELEIESKFQKFIVKDGVKILAEEEIIACHPMSYPYVVFYCHKMSNSTAHVVPLEGEDGTRVKAIVICHKDTSQWDPDHVAFQVLKVKPGTSPVCHFFPNGHLLWYAK
uniref:Resistant specific protein-2 n=1 Tax=Vigna radiata TaxID=157791 RepID=Q8H9E9_VIGRA|nr:resistant specific protein-2 [Vigna radiata]